MPLEVGMRRRVLWRRNSVLGARPARAGYPGLITLVKRPLRHVVVQRDAPGVLIRCFDGYNVHLPR